MTSGALLLLLGLLDTYAAFRQDGGCQFPARWEGTWFQSGVRAPIVVEGARLSNKGTCLTAENDKFLVVDDKRVCYRCVVIHEKHANVLQYKETFCHERDSLASLCRMITGDALLYSMFREGALPVPCPFRGPFTFTYNRGHGECRSPVSSIDVCTEDSRLLLSYQACPDVYGTESTVEELECLATWKEGSSRYLVGKVHHVHATSNEDRFRCFVWEKTAAAPGASQAQALSDDVDYRVAQSGDATCNGLFSATEGSRTMTLRRAPSLNRCRFPHWLSTSQHWHTLDYSATYSFHHRNSTLRVANATAGSEMKVVCAQVRHAAGARDGKDDNVGVIVSHFTMGCQSGYMCMAFHRRDAHVAEVQSGAHARRPEDACQPPYFNRSGQPYTTLVTTSPDPRQCPYMGKFTVTSLTITPSPHTTHSRILRKRDRFHWRHTLSSQHQVDLVSHGDGAHPDPRLQRHDVLAGSHLDLVTHGDGAHLDLVTHGDGAHADTWQQRHEVMAGSHLDLVSHGDGAHLDLVAHGDGVHGDSRQQRLASVTRRKRVDGVVCTSEGFKTLVVGCGASDTMEFYSDCPSAELISSYSCHGRWEENGTHYLITTPLSRTSHGARRYCFIYREERDFGSGTSGSPGGDSSSGLMLVHFSSSSHSCDRAIRPGVEGALAFNATSTGKCVETSVGARHEISVTLYLLPVLQMISYVIFQAHR